MNRTHPVWPIVQLLLAITVLQQSPLFAEVPPPSSPLRREVVERVIDGDSILLAGGEKVRYIGIDTPEFGEPFFQAALRANQALTEKKTVQLEICPQEPRDNHGRLLAYVFVNDLMVNAELLRRGLASTLIIPPCGLTQAGKFAYLELQAWRASEGRWQALDHRLLTTGQAKNHIGEYRTVHGRILEVSRKPKVWFLNFGQDFRTDFTIVIFSRTLEAFPKLQNLDLRGRQVSITGAIQQHNGPQIILNHPEQLEINPGPTSRHVIKNTPFALDHPFRRVWYPLL